MLSSSLTSKGQVTIPQEIRQELGLRSGDRVIFRVENGSIVISRQINDIEASFGLVKGKQSVSLEKMDAAIRKRGSRGSR